MSKQENQHPDTRDNSMKTAKPSTAERLRKLKNAFITQLPEQLSVIRELFLSLDSVMPAKEGIAELHRRIHTLKGTSASFGLKDLSAEAALGENLAKEVIEYNYGMKQTPDPDGSEQAHVNHTGTFDADTNFCKPCQWYDLMANNLDRIAARISCIDSVSLECMEILSIKNDNSTPESTSTCELSPSERIVYLCDDDPVQCENLAAQISCFGFKVFTFESIKEFSMKVVASPPDVIIMDMVHQGSQTEGADVIQEIMAALKEPIPVIFLSAQNDLQAHLAAVRAGSSAYFVKPANPSALCSTLHRLTTIEENEPYRIMIVEDDIYMSQIYATILKEAGMETVILNDPLRAMPVLSEFRPDLILMDMHMPGCNGMELAKSIRQMEAYIGTPIVFLSSETDIDLHFDARRMGGDEFLIKPIKPNHLISAVSVRAERMKLIRSFMIKDSMTGLYNHSTIKEYLSMHIEKAKRHCINICFAMIDIDLFKNVNDTYGHPVGDQVLISLASLLKRRLRKSDVIGRYGGEEFAVILLGCSITEAFDILDQLRKNFAAICFTAKGATFSSTFSCGVTALSQTCNEMEKLCGSADEALYAAKRRGRNRVIAAHELQY